MAVGIELRLAQIAEGQDPEALKEISLQEGKVRSELPLSSDAMYIKGQTLHVGNQVKAEDVGSVFGYAINQRPDHFRTMQFTEFDGDGIVTQRPRDYNLTAAAKTAIQGDSSVELTAATKFTSTYNLATSIYGMKQAWLWFGATVPASITVSSYAGSEAAENLIFSGTIDTSSATPNAELLIDGLPIVGFYSDIDTILVVESTESFTLKGDSSGDFYVAFRSSEVTFVNLTTEDNVVPQIEAKTGVDRLDYNTLKNKPNPSRLCSYLPVAAPFTTPTLSAGSPTKVAPACTVKNIKDFAFDVGNSRYYLDDATASGKWFCLNASTSINTNKSNHTVDLAVYKNGVFEEGLSISRWIAAGADKGAIFVSGCVQLSHNDYIELYITTSKSGKVTLSRLSINILETVGAS